MKYLILTLLLFTLNSHQPRKLPEDLKKLGVMDFNKPDEILRVWRYPEGGAVFEELFEFYLMDGNWISHRYTYLMEEYKENPEFISLRNKIALNIPERKIRGFANFRLLHKDAEVKEVCLCDTYLAEYRSGKQANFFTFNINEKSNTNSSKLRLISLLNEIINNTKQ